MKKKQRGETSERGVGGSASYGALNTTRGVKKGCPGEQPSGEAEAFPRKESSPLRTRSESSSAGASLQVRKVHHKWR